MVVASQRWDVFGTLQPLDKMGLDEGMQIYIFEIILSGLDDMNE